MKTSESLAYRLYTAHRASEPRSIQSLQELFNIELTATETSGKSKRVRLIYEIDATALPTSLEQYSVRYILSQFVAAGHAVTIVTYDKSWYEPLPVPSPDVFVHTLVAALRKIDSQNVNAYLASDLRKSATIDMLYAGLDGIALTELVGSGKGVDKKNSSRSMELILRRGFSHMLWGHFDSDIIIRLGVHESVQAAIGTRAFLDFPTAIRGRIPNMPDTEANEDLIFRSIMSIPDSQFSDAYIYMLTLGELDREYILQLLGTQPLETKKQLAVAITAAWADDFDVGLQARKAFEEAMKGERDYSDVVLYDADTTLFDAIASMNLFSRSELRRLFAGGAVRNIAAQDQKLAPEYMELQHGDIIRIGKKHHIRIQIP